MPSIFSPDKPKANRHVSINHDWHFMQLLSCLQPENRLPGNHQLQLISLVLQRVPFPSP